METSSNLQDREKPSPLCSPSSHVSNTILTATTTIINNGGTHIPITRSDPNNPYPTTFVTADTSSFKQVVQLLTGSSETLSRQQQQQQQQNPNPNPQDHQYLPHPPPPLPLQPNLKNFPIPPIRNLPKKPGFKLYERRNIMRNSLRISPLTAAATTNLGGSSNFSPRKPTPEILSPSLLEFPSLKLSPVTPLTTGDPFDSKGSPSTAVGNNNSSSSAAVEEEKEKRAIAEKGFYLHPSPREKSASEPPELLPLFPVTSPRVYES